MKKILRDKHKLLTQVGITVTDEIQSEMEKRVNNEIQLDNYCKSLINNHFEK